MYVELTTDPSAFALDFSVLFRVGKLQTTNAQKDPRAEMPQTA